MGFIWSINHRVTVAMLGKRQSCTQTKSVLKVEVPPTLPWIICWNVSLCIGNILKKTF